MTSSTPKKSVKPTATSAYIMPSISPFMTYWASRPASIAEAPAPNFGRIERGTAGSVPSRAHTLLLPRQLALAGGVFAIVPLDELAVLDHVFGDNRHGVLAVIIKGNLADNGVPVLHVGHLGDDLLAIGADLFDRVEDQIHGGKGEGAVGLRRVVVFLRCVFLHEELATRQLFRRRALAECQYTFGQRPNALNEGLRHDAGRSVENGLNAQLVHLRADAHPDRGEAAEIDNFRIERLNLRELGGKVLLVGGDAERTDDPPTLLGERFAEVLVVPLAIVGCVVDDGESLVAEFRHKLGVGLVLVDHGAVDAMHLGILVAVGDVG